MTKAQARLTKAYKKYHAAKRGKKSILSFLRSFMPEMILRTTKLEGERINRKTVSSLFR